MYRIIVLFPSVLLSISGCVSYDPQDVADPPKITLQQALIDVVKSLNEAKKESDRNGKVGLNPCAVTVSFNVSVKATEDGSLGLGVTAGPPVIPIGLTATGNYQQGAEGSRGNQVTVTLTSAACLPEGSLGATKPEKIL